MAQLTINIPDAQLPRVRAAFEYRYDPDDPATLEANGGVPVPIDAAFMKQWLANQIKRFVLAAEADQARRAARQGAADLDVT